MLKKDYLLRMVEQFAKLLETVLFKKQNNTEAFALELDKLSEQFLGNNIAFFESLSEESIVAYFEGKDHSLEKIQILAELFYQNANMNKALYLFEMVQLRSDCFSFEIATKIDNIKKNCLD